MTIKQVDVLKVGSIEELEYFYSKFIKTCERYKEQRGDGFQFTIDPDYDKLELEVTLNFLDLDTNDYTERDPQLN
jgi:hypothetical protein